MIVFVLTACPSGLRGHLSRWFLEISPGVFVGHTSARVRDRAWQRVVEMCGRGRALLVYSNQGEQRLAFRVHGHDWMPVDFDGIELIMRPGPGGGAVGVGPGEPLGSGRTPAGWSVASRRRKSGRRLPGVSKD